MCVTSAVIHPWTTPGDPGYIPWSPVYPSPNLAQEMLEVIRRLEDIDRRMKLTECKVEEIAKRKFKAKLQRRAKSKRRLR